MLAGQLRGDAFQLGFCLRRSYAGLQATLELICSKCLRLSQIIAARFDLREHHASGNAHFGHVADLRTAEPFRGNANDLKVSAVDDHAFANRIRGTPERFCQQL